MCSKPKISPNRNAFFFGMPTFELSAIITMTIVAIIIMIESIGAFFALGEITDRKLTGHDIKKGLRAEGVGGFISGIFNSFTHSTFSQNVGLVALTGVKSRYVLIAAGIILLILGLFPKVSALASMIPRPVLGGAMIPMFGMLIATSLRMINRSDLTKGTNQLVIAVGLGIALAIEGAEEVLAAYPDNITLIVGNGIVMGTITLFTLNLLLNGPDKTEHATNDPPTSTKAGG
ncbi:solute carrier family 23 protein [Natribacillus halophilus]|uniref:Permease family protein n=1 Tax=Natribacillus halophilus TaxID=549003 RepID=A0A1G8RZG6_9BACI|nr:solute carrier family 23 protein [Natribacillus halophilus]SDJ22343.1 Permease family protein [Natribacillus halophilus]